MLLTATNVVSFLFNTGLLESAAVVDGDLLVEEVHRRNRNFKVSRANGRGYFVKQVGRWDAEAFATLQVESECYREACENGEMSGLASLLPDYVHYDQARSILVTGLLENAESFVEHRKATGTIVPEAAGALGEALGRYHRCNGQERRLTAAQHTKSPRPPWILQLHRMASMPGTASQHSGGNQQMIQLLQRFPDFTAQLDRLAREWQCRCLIHGDMKWDNCMLLRDHGELAVKVVDWELAHWGDPAWDVGCVFSAFLAGWVQALPPAATQMPEQFEAFSDQCLMEMRPGVHAFWTSYHAALELPEPDCAGCLIRCLRYGAGRLLQTAYEYLQFASTVDPNTYLLLQVSCNVLTKPEEAAEELLGL